MNRVILRVVSIIVSGRVDVGKGSAIETNEKSDVRVIEVLVKSTWL